MSAVYTIFTSPDPAHPPVPDHLPTLIVTPHGKPQQILYTYLHTSYNRENYLLTPSLEGDLCVAKLFPPPPRISGKSSSSDGHGGGGSSHIRSVKCEASRNFRWTITNSGVLTPTYKCTLPSEDGSGSLADEQPLFQISKTNPSSPFWTMWYYAYAGHLIPPKRIQFGHISKTVTPEGKPVTGGGTRVTMTGKTDDEKAVWKTLGEGNEDMVEWAVISAALHVLDDEIVKAAEAAGIRIGVMPGSNRPPVPGASTPPMPGNIPRPTLHPTGHKPGQTPPASQNPPMIPNSRGPQQPMKINVPPQQQQHPQQPQRQQMTGPPRPGHQQQQQNGPPLSPGMDPRYRGPPPPQQMQQQHQGGPPPQMRDPRTQGGPLSPPQGHPPMTAPHQGPPQGLMGMRNGQSPRPNHAPIPPGGPQQYHGGPPPDQMRGGPMSPPGGPMSPPGGAMSPPNGMSPPRHFQQQPPRNGAMPSPQMQQRQPPPPQQQPYPPNGVPHPQRQHHHALSPGPQQPEPSRSAPPPNLAQMRTRSPLPPPGSSAPSSSLPIPGGSNGNGMYNGRPAPNTPSRRDQQQTPAYPSPQSRARASPIPPPQQDESDDETIDSVAFMLGTTALNDAAAPSRSNDPPQPDKTGGIGNGREPVKGGYNSRVQRVLHSNRER